jgi:hypothetical protein
VICIFAKLVAAIEAHPFLKVVVFLACLAIFGGPAFLGTLRAADKYAHIEIGDWNATNVWVKSAECARRTGAWLARAKATSSSRSTNGPSFLTRPGGSLRPDFGINMVLGRPIKTRCLR